MSAWKAHPPNTPFRSAVKAAWVLVNESSQIKDDTDQNKKPHLRGGALFVSTD